MIRDSRYIAEAYTSIPQKPTTPVPGAVAVSLNQAEQETAKPQIKDWLRLESGLCPIDTVRKADHVAHVVLQFIYSICSGPDAVHRVIKTLNKAYKQDKK